MGKIVMWFKENWPLVLVILLILFGIVWLGFI